MPSRKQKQAVSDALAADEDLRAVLSTPAGKRVWWRLITRVTGAYGEDFEIDSRVHAFNSGKRAIGLALAREAQRVAPRAYLEMVRDRINQDVLAIEAEQAEAGNTSTG